jgi:Fe-S cluster assembly ATPase SufC
MDMSLVMMAMALQAGKLQTEVATTMLKSNLDAQKSTVQTLLGTGGQGASSLANVGAGIGGNLNVTA